MTSLFCLSVVFVQPAWGCGGDEAWLTDEEIAAYKRGEEVHLRQMSTFEQVDLAFRMQSDPWAWLDRVEFRGDDTTLVLSDLGNGLFATLDAPFQFASVDLPLPADVLPPIDTIERLETDLNLKRVVIACDGNLLTGSHLL
jgi:hypothetical protein